MPDADAIEIDIVYHVDKYVDELFEDLDNNFVPQIEHMGFNVLSEYYKQNYSGFIFKRFLITK